MAYQHLTQDERYQIAAELAAGRSLADIAQQTMAHYEGGTARIAVAMLPTVARVLGVSIEELIGEGRRAPGKRGPAPKLQQQLEQLTRLPKAKQRFVSEMLDSVLAQTGR